MRALAILKGGDVLKVTDGRILTIPTNEGVFRWLPE
jgi:hypothetical protein